MDSKRVGHGSTPRMLGSPGRPPTVRTRLVVAPPFLQPADELFVNARSAWHSLLVRLAAPRVWLPSYLCPELKASIPAGTVIRFYEVDGHLHPRLRDTLDEIAPDDVVLLIEYFGMPVPDQVMSAVQSRNACIVVDACHALLTAETRTGADFVLFSPRKFVRVVDGGILSSRSERVLSRIELSSAPDEPLQGTSAAVPGREESPLAEANAPLGMFRMPESTRSSLCHDFDYDDIASRRRENFAALLNNLGEFAIFPRLPQSAVPLGFPIRLENRNQVLTKLVAHKICPPPHWSIDGVVPLEFAASHLLALEILTLPCDQRYDRAAMQQMARLVRQIGRAK